MWMLVVNVLIRKINERSEHVPIQIPHKARMKIRHFHLYQCSDWLPCRSNNIIVGKHQIELHFIGFSHFNF